MSREPPLSPTRDPADAGTCLHAPVEAGPATTSVNPFPNGHPPALTQFALSPGRHGFWTAI